MSGQLTQEEQGSKRRPFFRTKTFSYLTDWVFVIIMGILWGLLGKLEPFHREFSLTDKTIMYPHKPDTITFSAAAAICSVIPLATIIFLCILRHWKDCLYALRNREHPYKFYHDLHIGILSFVVAMTMNLMFTNVVKNLAGRKRPDFIARCKPKAGSSDPTWGLSTNDVCTETDEYLMQDGQRSFPSGHSSFSFAGLGYMSFFIAGYFKLYDGRGFSHVAYLANFPLLFATYVALTRVSDYRHHWQDVFIGSLLGLGMAYFAYRVYYPPLGSDDAGEPYNRRCQNRENNKKIDGNGSANNDSTSGAQDFQPPIHLSILNGPNHQFQGHPHTAINYQGV
ncbi:hypothetical protein H4219_002462 [Mycoemilia scoparia]|uniref:Phosphatidic acid phosphatase type 2/haloperoxidase domain-containing protein n=1 Tax=Mycoemilia scoparia TaxID=417184 RepID=A0A9W8DUC6_9FUNG|nr:hypothetical protein H4219_002462 [Mycoemilia scoparia]